MTSRINDVLDRLLAVRRAQPLSQKPLVLTVVVALLVAGLALAIPQLGLSWDEFRFAPLVVLAVLGAPAATVVNALEYRIIASSLRRPTTWSTAMRVAVVGTAANLLPIPGAVAVRVRELRVEGADWVSATATTASLGVVWVAEALVATLIVGLVQSNDALALSSAAAAGLASLLAFVLLRRGLPDDVRAGPIMTRMAIVEALLLAVSTGRMALALMALGISDPWGGAVGLALSAALASAVGLLPAGLGVREGLATLISPLVGLSAAVGFTATVVNRVAGLVVDVVVAFLVLGGSRPPR